MRRALRYRIAWLVAIFAGLLLGGSSRALAGDATLSQFVGSTLGQFGTRKEVLKTEARFATATDEVPARLYITSQIEPGWHIYAISQKPGGPLATKIKLEPSDAYRVLGEFSSFPVPHEESDSAIWPDLPIQSHEDEVTWYVPIELTPGVDVDSLEINGRLTAQACDDDACLPPTNYDFVARVGQPIEIPAAVEPAEPTPAAANVPPAGAERLDLENLRIEQSETGLILALCGAFLGGLILNLMPCVLPVIGLKILAFVEQSGQSRSRIFALNVWYTLGMLAVFMVLATLAVFFKLGWGQQFSFTAFNVTLTAVVFTMGLSFLGVWEIPIPGFVGSGQVQDLAAKEGLAGAFCKGAVTTVLATPCSGPFLGTALVWAAKQSAPVAYLAFLFVGLGMASPYLLIGAFPRLIRFLPKPGAWMETFKNTMGFVLLGTVVFLLTVIEPSFVVPTIALLFGLWAACWWIGRTSLTASFGHKLRAWAEAAAFAGAVGLFALTWLHDVMSFRFEEQVTSRIATMQTGNESTAMINVSTAELPETRDVASKTLPWQPFSLARLQELTDAEQTVLIDFTANWCNVCKTLEYAVLNTERTSELVERYGVATLKADWTYGSEEVTQMLNALESNQIPVVAIFPAGRPNDPIVFVGSYTFDNISEALEQAGPSKTVATAMR